MVPAEQWWAADEYRVGPALFEAVAAIEASQTERRYANVIYNRLATGRDLPNVYGLSMARRSYQAFASALASYQPPSVNVCAMAVESLTAKIGRNRPWVMFSTTDASWKARRRAELLSRYIDGIFWSSGFWNILPDVFRDMLVFCDGTGVAKWFIEDGKIKCERVIPEEIMVDSADAVHGRPRSLYQRTFGPKARLAAKFPGKADEIMVASGAAPGLGWYAGEHVPEQFAPIVEGWHMDDAGGESGRHLFTVGDKVISDKTWKAQHFPFSFLRGYPVGSGFWRQGIVEQLVPYQSKLDRIEKVIDESGWRMGTPKWFSPFEARVSAAMLVAKVAAVVPYHGNHGPPTRDVGPALSPEWYAERDKWIRLAFDRVGMSQDSVTGTKPDGLYSGEAQRVHSQIASIRQSTLALALEEFVVQSAERVLDLARELQPVVKSPGRRGVRLINWTDTKLDPDGFIMKAFPISSLPAEPAGRIQRANEMLQMGLLTKEQYARLLGNPDVEQSTDPIEAARDAIEAMLDAIVEDGDYEGNGPEKYAPLDLQIQLGMARYLREKSLGAPDDVLENLSRWIEEARSMAKPPAAAALPGAAAAPSMPQLSAMPGPTPDISQIAAADVLPSPAPVPQIAPPMAA